MTAPKEKITEQRVSRKLATKDPHDPFQSVADVFREKINCETVCILLWNDREELLITEYPSGLPEDLDHAEVYKINEGVTGKYIFNEGRSIRGLVDLKKRTIRDLDSGSVIKDRTTKWENMEKYGNSSKFGNFKSLLGFPLSVNSEQLGAIKLINKFNAQSDGLDPDGFTADDYKTVRSWLDSIEHVIETKTHEDRIEEFLDTSKEISNADFDYRDLLSKVAASCAKAMNCKLCVIRLMEKGRLTTKVPDVGTAVFDEDRAYSLAAVHALSEKTAVKWSSESALLENRAGEVLSRRVPQFARKRGFRSFVITPITYQNRSIGTIECYSTLPRRFSPRELDVADTFGSSLVATIFQRARVGGALTGLSTPLALFATLDDLCSGLFSIIEKYLGAKALSIWNKSVSKESDWIELAWASDSLLVDYRKNNILELPKGSFTGDVLASGNLQELDAEQIRSDKFAFSKFAKKHGFSSATLVPVGIGTRAHAVIDVFYDHDRKLFHEEQRFLELLATKTAGAIQRIKLIDAFNAIHDAAVEGDLKSTSREITKRALDVLHADVVILFIYDSVQKRFIPTPIRDGELFDEDVVDRTTKIRDHDLVNHIRLGEARYLKNRDAYIEYLIAVNRKPRKHDFWHREKIVSSAGIPLKRRDEVVGVLWVNYRECEAFDDGTKRLIQAFAALAASEIANARLLEEKREFEQMQAKDLMELSLGWVAGEMGTEAPRILSRINVEFAIFDKYITAARKARSVPDEKQVKTFRNALTEAVAELEAISEILKRRQEFGKLKLEKCNAVQLIQRALRTVRRRFEREEVNIEMEFGRAPKFTCDRAQIEHMLLALYFSALNAMKASTERTISIKVKAERGRSQQIVIEISHTGAGIRDEILDSLFDQTAIDGDPCFRICQRIAERHGGKFELDTNCVKGWRALIRLPV